MRARGGERSVDVDRLLRNKIRHTADCTRQREGGAEVQREIVARADDAARHQGQAATGQNGTAGEGHHAIIGLSSRGFDTGSETNPSRGVDEKATTVNPRTEDHIGVRVQGQGIRRSPGDWIGNSDPAAEGGCRPRSRCCNRHIRQQKRTFEGCDIQVRGSAVVC